MEHNELAWDVVRGHRNERWCDARLLPRSRRAVLQTRSKAIGALPNDIPACVEELEGAFDGGLTSQNVLFGIDGAGDWGL